MPKKTMDTLLEEATLAALLSSKLCHDLVSPVGALSNGLDLLLDSPDPAIREQATVLLRNSLQAANSKLTYYRLAFGASLSSGSKVLFSEVREAAEAYLGTYRRIELTWHEEGFAGQDIYDSKLARLILNLVMVAKDTLIRGGEVIVSIMKIGDEITLSVRAKGRDPMLSEDVVAALSLPDSNQGINAMTTQPYLVALLIASLQADLTWSQPSDEEIAFTATISL